MPNQLINWLKNHPKIVVVVIVLMVVAALIFVSWKKLEQTPEQPNEPKEINFPPAAQEQPNAVDKPKPRDAKGRFIKKTRCEFERNNSHQPTLKNYELTKY